MRKVTRGVLSSSWWCWWLIVICYPRPIGARWMHHLPVVAFSSPFRCCDDRRGSSYRHHYYHNGCTPKSSCDDLKGCWRSSKSLSFSTTTTTSPNQRWSRKHTLWISSRDEDNEGQQEFDYDSLNELPEDNPRRREWDQAIENLTPNKDDSNNNNNSEQFRMNNNDDSITTIDPLDDGYSILDLMDNTSTSTSSSSYPSLLSSEDIFDKRKNDNNTNLFSDFSSQGTTPNSFGPTIPLVQNRKDDDKDDSDSFETVIDDDSNDDDDEIDSGLYLDPDVYMNYRNYMNDDGSLRFPKEDDIRMSRKGPSQVIETILDPPMSPNAEGGGGGEEDDDNDKVQEESQSQKRSSPSPSQPQRSRKAAATSSSSSSPPPTIDDLLQALKQAQTQDKQSQALRAEQLHQEVFKNEQAYLEQSEIFRQSLTNKTAVQEATAFRRSANYRQRQAKEMQKLDEQIDDFEATLKQMAELSSRSRKKNQNTEDLSSVTEHPLSTTTNTTTVTNINALPKPRICSKCECVLKRDELEYTAASYKRLCPSCYKTLVSADLLLQIDDEEKEEEDGLNDNDDGENFNDIKDSDDVVSSFSAVEEYYGMGKFQDDGIDNNNYSNNENEDDIDGDEWVEVDDPSTGDHFYWNEKTGEMRREI